MNPTSGFTVEELENVVVVTLNCDKLFHEDHIQRLGSELLELVPSDPEMKFLMDTQCVSFMSAAFIGKLILLDKKLKRHDSRRRLYLCGVQDSVMEVFNLMRLEKVLRIYKDRDKAIFALS